MSYKQIKWLILLIPTLTIGLWEYIRHEFLLDYISMQLGNWLSPVLVFFITILVTYRLFNILENNQEELKQEKTLKAALEEREEVARELHDGISQSLFLLSVKINQLERLLPQEEFLRIRKTVQHIYEDVRQAISNLRHDPSTSILHWTQMLKELIANFERETGIYVSFTWEIPEYKLSPHDKVELYACLKETLMNIRKHADCEHVWIIAKEETDRSWTCKVIDDGKGFTKEEIEQEDSFGLQILKDRTKKMGWTFELRREYEQTVAQIRKES